jgi:hypothetical protein
VAPLRIVATYGVAGRAVEQAYTLAKQATAALMPQLGDPSLRREATRTGTVVFSGVVVSGMCALALVGQPLLTAWAGPIASGELAARVTALLALASAIMGFYEVASSAVMLGSATAWACAVPIAAGSAVNLAVSILWAPVYGAWAVAGSTVIGNAITALLMWRTARRLVGFSGVDLVATLAPGVVGGVVAFAVGAALRGFAQHGAGASVVACGITMAAGCAVVVATLRGRMRGSQVAVAGATGEARG